ncbi:MAG: cytochrome c biogenesis protein ResB [Coriobacteriia bacterium]|nr:cytochrome c biogenesis protein ResB [Coriobacteriia bacterium]
MRLLHRIYNILRSRRLAFVLIAAFVGYTAIATVTGESDYGQAYSRPLFIAIATALASATAACAWERTVSSSRLWRRGTGVTPGFVRTLTARPQIAVTIPGGADTTGILERVAARLGPLHLRVISGKGRVVGTSGRLSLVGSPLFHWCLVLLFVLVGAGRLTRSEGMIGIPVGSERVDAAGSYFWVDVGPLHGEDFSGVTIRVSELRLDYTAGGVSRGAAPVVELYDEGDLVGRRVVYPNSPLRYGSMMVHPSDYGLAGKFTLTGYGEPQVVEVLYDFSKERPVAENHVPLEDNRPGGTLTLSTSIPLDIEEGLAEWVMPEEPRVDWVIDDAGITSMGTVRPGESIDLGDGMVLTLDEVTHYARVSVVNDWSVYPIYATFALGMIGLALALLVSPKTVWVMVISDADKVALHARTRQGRGDRLFADAVRSELEAAVREG